MVQREEIKISSCYKLDVIYKTVKLTHNKKIQIIQNINDLIFQVIFKFSDWILIKQMAVSSTTPWCLGKQVFEKTLPGRMSNFPLPKVWLQEFGGKFLLGRGIRAWLEMARFNAFSSNVDTIY